MLEREPSLIGSNKVYYKAVQLTASASRAGGNPTAAPASVGQGLRSGRGRKGCWRESHLLEHPPRGRGRGMPEPGFLRSHLPSGPSPGVKQRKGKISVTLLMSWMVKTVLVMKVGQEGQWQWGFLEKQLLISGQQAWDRPSLSRCYPSGPHGPGGWLCSPFLQAGWGSSRFLHLAPECCLPPLLTDPRLKPVAIQRSSDFPSLSSAHPCVLLPLP